MSPFDSFLLLAEVVALLWLLWLILEWSLDAIGEWQAAARESREDSSPTKERESSAR